MAKVKSKKCNECETRKPVASFDKHKNAKDGYRGTCKKCRAEGKPKPKPKPKAKRKLSPAAKVALANKMASDGEEHPLAPSLRKLFKRGVRSVEFDDKGVAKLTLVSTETVRGL